MRPAPYPPPAPPARNRAATAALVLGIFSFLGGITAVPGLVAGFLGLNRAERTGAGRRPAVAGILFSLAGLPVGLYTVAYLADRFAPPSPSPGDDDAPFRQDSSDNLLHLGSALKDFDAARGALPLAAICDDDGNPLLSWRVAVLPQLGQNELFEKFDLTQPWDGPTNKPLLTEMPAVYAWPKDGEAAKRGETRYKVFAGPGAVFGYRPPGPDARSERINLGEWSVEKLFASPRGGVNLVFVAEAGDPVPWTRPADLPYSPNGPLPPMASPYKDHLLLLMGDGRVLSARGKPAEYEAALRASLDPQSVSPATFDP